MNSSIAEECRSCLASLGLVSTGLWAKSSPHSTVHPIQAQDLVDRFTLWAGNIGATHSPQHSLSLETRLQNAPDVLIYVLELLTELNETISELLTIISGAPQSDDGSNDIDLGGVEPGETQELLDEMQDSIKRLFKVSGLIRQVAPADIFTRALSRSRYQFNHQFDIAYVGEKYPKLATESTMWLRQKLGQAITQRRSYLAYTQDHREKLETGSAPKVGHDQPQTVNADSANVGKDPAPLGSQLDSRSRQSTHITKVSTPLQPGLLTPQIFLENDAVEAAEDARSYTTITRSVDGDTETSAAIKIPTLQELRKASTSEVECPYCFRIEKFKSERHWRRHVFSDLRAYVCTFEECEVAYFGDRDEWFEHEMQNHRVEFCCRVCPNGTFARQDSYLVHVRHNHPDLLGNSEEKLVVSIAKRMLSQIPTQDCPCCSEWTDRIRSSMGYAHLTNGPSDVVCAEPRIFKRHLAAHLEQLALFALPFPASGGGEGESNIALADYDPKDQLEALFVDVESPFTDDQVGELEKLLHRLTPQWSAVPRTYAILRITGHLELLHKFIEANLSDYFIPYSQQHLQRIEYTGDIKNFLDAQKLLLTSPTPDSVLMGRHRHFSGYSGSIMFQHLEWLSDGDSAKVGVVTSDQGLNKFVRKLRTRAHSTVRGENKEAWQLQYLFTEVEVLRRIRHPNIVRYVGSFTDAYNFGCIISPVAHMTLEKFLPHAGTQLRTFFGCLASAVDYLHGQNVVHNDIKPSHVLVHGDEVYLAGFSLSLDLSNSDDGTVDGKPLAFTRRYCAPEILNWEKRDSKVDIWSLGLVFAEMFITLKGSRHKALREAVQSETTATLLEDLAKLEKEESSSDDVILSWIRPMLAVDQHQRPSATTLLQSIQMANSNTKSLTFFASCCDSAEESHSAIEEHSHHFTLLTLSSTIDEVNAHADIENMPDVPSKSSKELHDDYILQFMDLEHTLFGPENPSPFTMIETLSRGIMGDVIKVTNTANSREYALKRVHIPQIRQKQKTQRMRAELDILKRIEHFHVIPYLGSFMEELGKGYQTICFLHPVAEMDLQVYLEKTTLSKPQELRTFFGCLATALNYLHGQGIRHGDIKPSNILVDHGNVVMSGFGSAFAFDLEGNAEGITTDGDFSFTRRYCAPEVHLKTSNSLRSDIWSLGVTFVQMLATLKSRTLEEIWGHANYISSDNIGTLTRSLEDLRSIRNPIDNTPLDWIPKMLSQDPKLRPSASSLAAQITKFDMENTNLFCGVCCLSDQDYKNDDM